MKIGEIALATTEIKVPKSLIPSLIANVKLNLKTWRLVSIGFKRKALQSALKRFWP